MARASAALLLLVLAACAVSAQEEPMATETPLPAKPGSGNSSLPGHLQAQGGVCAS
jgi:hypothetical protein